jgi:hypothetical protein
MLLMYDLIIHLGEMEEAIRTGAELLQPSRSLEVSWACYVVRSECVRKM